MRFTKMHGAGNDYVYVDCFAQPAPENPPELARRIADRHTGVGGDGLILIGPSESADARMRMFNADGSEAQMCGNGIRCVAKYLYDHGLTNKTSLRIETGAGPLELELHVSDGEVDTVRVDMGRPILVPSDVPTTLGDEAAIDTELLVADRTLRVTCISMGNPHCITFVDSLNDDWVLGIGPKIETHDAFPERVNAEFVEIISSDEVRMRVWERGSGETMACGTGASAVCVAGALTGRTGRSILAHLPGGDLRLDWADDDHVYMTGPATEVFSGDWPEEHVQAVR